jgi:hypothetical protein
VAPIDTVTPAAHGGLSFSTEAPLRLPRLPSVQERLTPFFRHVSGVVNTPVTPLKLGALKKLRGPLKRRRFARSYFEISANDGSLDPDGVWWQFAVGAVFDEVLALAAGERSRIPPQMKLVEDTFEMAC